MAGSGRVVIGGIDTHGSTHHAAAIDVAGRILATAQFEADSCGDRELHSWLRGHGEVSSVGVERTGSCGAGLARYLSAQDVDVQRRSDASSATRHARSRPTWWRTCAY